MADNPWVAGGARAKRSTRNDWSSAAPCAAAALVFSGPNVLSPVDAPSEWDGEDAAETLAIVCGTSAADPTPSQRDDLEGLFERLNASCWFVTGTKYNYGYNCHGLTLARARAIANLADGANRPLGLATIGFDELAENMVALGYDYREPFRNSHARSAFSVVFGSQRAHSASRSFWTNATDAVLWDSKLGYDGGAVSLRIVHSLAAIGGHSYGDPSGSFQKR